MRIAVVDLETTGFLPERHQILEIGAVVVDLDKLDSKVADDFTVQIEYPEYTVEQGAIVSNQIDLRTWSGQNPAAALNSFMNWIRTWTTDKYPAVCGHNVVKHDLPFLKHFSKSHAGRTMPVEFSYLVRDTMQIAMHLKDKGVIPSTVSLKLGDLCDHFGIQTYGDAHRALPDAKRTADLLRTMLKL